MSLSCLCDVRSGPQPAAAGRRPDREFSGDSPCRGPGMAGTAAVWHLWAGRPRRAPPPRVARSGGRRADTRGRRGGAGATGMACSGNGPSGSCYRRQPPSVVWRLRSAAAARWAGRAAPSRELCAALWGWLPWPLVL